MSFESYFTGLEKADSYDRDHPTAQQLRDIYGQSVKNSAFLRASDLGVDPSAIYGVVADVGTPVGKRFVEQVCSIAKGAAEVLDLSDTPGAAEHFDRASRKQHVGLLVPRGLLPALTQGIAKAYGDREEKTTLCVGRDGMRAFGGREALKE